MRHLLTAVGIAAALALIGASCALNALFWSKQAVSEHEGHVLGAVSVAVDVLKAILPIFIAAAVACRRYAYAAVASVAFVLFFAAGLVSAVGFVASNKGDLVGSREGRNAQLDLAAKDLDLVSSELQRFTGSPPIAVAEAELRRLEQSPRFTSSNRCEDATAPASRQFCSDFFSAKATLAAAVEANRLTSKRDALVAEVNRLRSAGAGQEVDPQAGIFARWLPGLSVGTVRDALALFFALLIEIGAAFGLYLATRHSGSGARRNQGEPVILEPVREVNRVDPPAKKRITVAPDQMVRFVPNPKWIEG